MQTNQHYQLYTDYFRELRERIIAKKLHTPSPIFGSIALFVSISLFLGGIVFMADFHPVIVGIYFYILLVELGYISHDLIHGQYFKKAAHNKFFSYITANLLTGLSRSWWMQKHNIGHHTYTNSDVHDTDIRDYDEIFTNNGGKSPFFHKHKVILFWCVTSVLYFNLIILSYRYIIKERKYNELVLNLLSLLLLPTALIMNFGWFGVLIFLGMYVVVGIHLAFAFMVNHIGMPIIDGATIREYAWLDLQTLTSRNVSGGSVVHHIFGGLNKQIEHHLFPQVARNKIQKVSLEVRDFCKEKGIPYHDVSFWQGLKEIYRTLKTGETVRFEPLVSTLK